MCKTSLVYHPKLSLISTFNLLYKFCFHFKVSESFSGSKKQKQMYKQFSDEFLEKAFIESYQKRWKEIQDNQFSETKHVDDTSTLIHENKIDSKSEKQVSVDTLKSDNESISSELNSEFSDDDYDDDDDLLSLSSTTTKQNSTNVSDDENQNRFSLSNDELSEDNKDTETLNFDQAHESFPVSSSSPSKPNVLDHKLSGDSVDQSLKEISSNSINILDENKLLVEDNPDVKSVSSCYETFYMINDVCSRILQPSKIRDSKLRHEISFDFCIGFQDERRS